MTQEECFNEALALFDKGKYKKAIPLLEDLADEGYVKALVFLGKCYANGEGIEQSYTIAAEIYKRAANQGDLQAKEALDTLIKEGKVSARTAPQTVNASLAEADAKYKARWDKAYSLFFIDDKPKNAFPLLEALANEGYARAQEVMGICYSIGKGVKQDYLKAFQWRSKAADQGYVEAEKSLGYCYYNGHGVSQNYAKAAEWWQKAAAQGNAQAKEMLEELKREGKI